jgi:hypothetical protein
VPNEILIHDARKEKSERENLRVIWSLENIKNKKWEENLIIDRKIVELFGLGEMRGG